MGRAMEVDLPEVDQESFDKVHTATALSSSGGLESTSASSSTGSVKRRLRWKQTPTPEGPVQPRSLETASEDAVGTFGSSFWQNFDKEEWVSLDHRKKYLFIYWKLRHWASKRVLVAPEQPLVSLNAEVTADQLIPYALGGLRDLTRDQKAVVFGRFCALSSAPEEIMEMVKD